MNSFPLDDAYLNFLQEVKQKILQAQTKSVSAVNQQLVILYWELGNDLLSKQKKLGWGAGVTTQLSKDLKIAFPNVKGFSKRNLDYMKKFASLYPDRQILQQAVAKIGWSHNTVLIHKCKTQKERIWYAQKALEHGWSRNMMVHHIEMNLFGREGKAITNFSNTLPTPQSDLAQQSLKDPYIFDFLTMSQGAREKDLEDQLVQHITKFLLELGAGFSFLGRQYAVSVGKEDYYIDLLFYHIKLRCYVVMELKVGNFKPEYAGKMNFYLSAVDDILKTEHENPSIGIILCKNKENIVVEYALKNTSSPIGVSEYKLMEAIPDNLQSSLPTIEDFERELKNLNSNS